ncbi:MAG: hypothetical protein IJP33_04125 [Firmicutes bacterium]|nr:hypothetical protein [Bacillota bacterium]
MPNAAYYNNQRHYRSTIKKYRLFPTSLAGILVFGLVLFLAGLLWAILAFLLIKDPDEIKLIPYIIYFLSVAAGCATSSAICRGTSIIPALAVAVLAAAMSFIGIDLQELSIWGLILKLVLNILIAFIITVIAKAIGSRENRNINLRGELKF